METEKYATLLKVIERGSLSAAAEELGYSPSGISKLIATLESDIGIRLLERNKHGVYPTEACNQLLPAINRTVQAELAYYEKVDALKGLSDGSIRIGSSIDEYAPAISRLVAQFHEQYPKVTVTRTHGFSSSILKMLRSREIDLAIITKREKDTPNWIPLSSYELVAYAPPDSPYESIFPLKDIETTPYIELYPGLETDTSLVLEQHGLSPSPRYSCHSVIAAFELVATGLGYTLENRNLIKRINSKVKVLPLDPPQNIEIGFAVNEIDTLSPAAKRFIELATESEWTI